MVYEWLWLKLFMKCNWLVNMHNSVVMTWQCLHEGWFIGRCVIDCYSTALPSSPNRESREREEWPDGEWAPAKPSTLECVCAGSKPSSLTFSHSTPWSADYCYSAMFRMLQCFTTKTLFTTFCVFLRSLSLRLPEKLKRSFSGLCLFSFVRSIALTSLD